MKAWGKLATPCNVTFSAEVITDYACKEDSLIKKENEFASAGIKKGLNWFGDLRYNYI